MIGSGMMKINKKLERKYGVINMLSATVKKLWRGCITLRESWVNHGIANGGLIVELKIKGKSKGKSKSKSKGKTKRKGK